MCVVAWKMNAVNGIRLITSFRHCVKCQSRGVRHRYISNWQFRTPWPFVHRRTGLVSYGPFYKEIWEWPEEEHAEFTPKFKGNNLPMLRGTRLKGFSNKPYCTGIS